MLILVIEGTVTDLMCADQVVVIIDLQFIFDSNQFDSFGGNLLKFARAFIPGYP